MSIVHDQKFFPSTELFKICIGDCLCGRDEPDSKPSTFNVQAFDDVS